MKRLGLAWGCLLGSVVLAGCYGHGARSQDGQSHWLRQCSSGSTCGDDEICACGVCTRLCKDDSSCGADAQCMAVAQAASCSDAPAGIKQVCLASCSGVSDCESSHAAALSCVDAVCVMPASRDAGPTSVATLDAGSDAGHVPTKADFVNRDASTPPPLDPNTHPFPEVTGAPIILQPLLQGDLIVATVSSTNPLYMKTCEPLMEIEKYSVEADRRLPIHDDRPPAYNNPGYYLDGLFIPPNHSLDCDEQICMPFPERDRIVFGEAYEYFKTGTRVSPAGYPDIPAMVDVIERRPLSGEITVNIAYYEAEGCNTHESGGGLTFEIPTPEAGVCCPIGEAGCASTGPRGGWATRLDKCRPFEPAPERAQLRRDDPRGCPVLLPDESSCCGCDADAGR